MARATLATLLCKRTAQGWRESTGLPVGLARRRARVRAAKQLRTDGLNKLPLAPFSACPGALGACTAVLDTNVCWHERQEGAAQGVPHLTSGRGRALVAVPSCNQDRMLAGSQYVSTELRKKVQASQRAKGSDRSVVTGSDSHTGHMCTGPSKVVQCSLHPLGPYYQKLCIT